MSRTYNPFLEANFNTDQLAFANTDAFDSETRIPITPLNPDQAPSVNRLLFKGYMYTDDNLELI